MYILTYICIQDINIHTVIHTYKYIHACAYTHIHTYAHTDYRFQDSPSQDDADNYTNRSPFPVFHLLKVEEVTKAINDYGDTSMIWKNNKKVMNQLGVEKLKEINKKILVDAKNECDAK